MSPRKPLMDKTIHFNNFTQATATISYKIIILTFSICILLRGAGCFLAKTDTYPTHMLRLVALSVCTLAVLANCKNEEKEKELLKKEAEIIEKEKQLEEESDILVELEAAVELNPEVQLNLIHCENDDVIIRVDRLKSNDVRYMAWNKPKSSTERPDLILLDGKIENQGSSGGYHFIFSNGHYTYIIEHKLPKDQIDTTSVYLRFLEGNEEKLYAPMKDLKLK